MASCCLSILIDSQAQDIKKIKLKGLYVGTFAQVLDQISKEHGVKFTFDRELLENHKVEDYPDNLRLEAFLEYWCLLFDLRYFVADGVINVRAKMTSTTRKRN